MSTEVIEAVRGEWDEDGFHFDVDTSDGTRHFRVTSTEVARELVSATLMPLTRWLGEEARQRAAYDAASPEERARVLGGPSAHDSHDGWVAGCPDCEEQARVAGDLLRKAERENR